jgi:hypothetical protein
MPPVGLKIEINVLGERQIQRKMMRWTERAMDMRPAFGAVAEYLMRVEARQFDTEGAASGHPWAPLAASTKKRKEALGLRPEVLRATDALRDALTIPGDKNQKVLMTRDTLVFGVKGDPAEYGPRLMKQTPGGIDRARKPVDLTELNRRAAIKMIQLWVARGVTTIFAA